MEARYSDPSLGHESMTMEEIRASARPRAARQHPRQESLQDQPALAMSHDDERRAVLCISFQE
jgi:hypothetical protein